MRCLAIPGLAFLFYLPQQHTATTFLFAMASITDWWDGYLARRWDITSDFGAFLDPVADKLMVSTGLILLSGRYGAIVGLPSAIILAREIAVSALREWMAQRGQREAVQVGFQGKVKTALTMVALTMLLLVDKTKNGTFGSLYVPAMLMLYACMIITVTSGSVYFRAAAPIFFRKDETGTCAENKGDDELKSS
jgi:CDP-diacylglycerol--glycerol-3-phosphate 3-phosphatidyltransferase